PTPTLQLPSVLTLDSRISIDYPAGYTVDHFEWTFTPLDAGSAVSSSVLAAVPSSGISWTSANTQTDLASRGLKPGPYQVSVTAVGPSGGRSATAEQIISLVSANLNAVKTYPNPWKKTKDGSIPITFDNLSSDVQIKIFTVSGHMVRRLGPGNGRITWDLRT